MQRTMVRHLRNDTFEEGLRPFFTYRDLGVKDATNGAMGAHVIRTVPGSHAQPNWHTHELTFQIAYVLKGWVEFEYEDIGTVRLEAGSLVYQPPMVRHREIAHSEDLEVLEITSPAEFATSIVPAPAQSQAAE